jgi:hypothetical protein
MSQHGAKRLPAPVAVFLRLECRKVHTRLYSLLKKSNSATQPLKGRLISKRAYGIAEAIP